MKLNYKNIRLFLILLGSISIVYIIFSIIKVFSLTTSLMATHKATLRSIPTEYLHLFNTDKFTNEFTEISTLRYPISRFDYDSNKYVIIVAKINTIKNTSLDSLIEEKFNTESVEEKGGHLSFSLLKFDFNFSPNLLKAAQIFVCLNGDSIKSVAKNDTSRTYYFRMKSFSLKYIGYGQDDLFGISKSDYDPPTLLTFVKSNGSVYFILISANYDDILERGLLNKLAAGY